jgi:hypothetical protein
MKRKPSKRNGHLVDNIVRKPKDILLFPQTCLRAKEKKSCTPLNFKMANERLTNEQCLKDTFDKNSMKLSS